MIRPRFIVAFSGHRTLGDPDSVRERVGVELARLKEQVESTAGGVLEFYGSIAYGSDTIAVEACRGLGIPLHLILPKPVVKLRDGGGEVDTRRGFAADFWDGAPSSGGIFRSDDWDRAYKQIEDARQGVDGATLRLAAGSHVDPECYYDAGLRTLDACDLLLAVWDGEPAAGLGGTGDMVDYARQDGLPTVIVPPDASEEISRERLGDFAKPADPGLAIMSDVGRHCAERECVTLPSDGEQSAGALFEDLEACSAKNSDEFRNSLVKMIRFHGWATLVAAAAAILPQTSLQWKIVLATFAAIEACLVGWAFFRARRLHKSKTHEGWMRSRFAVEVMRGLRDSRGLLDPLHPLVARHRPEWRRFAISAGLQIRREAAPVEDWQQARDDYVNTRLLSEDIKQGQIKYFEKAQKEAKRRFDKTRRWGGVFGFLALIFVGGAVLFKVTLVCQKLAMGDATDALAITYGGSVLPWVYDVAFKFLPIALPLLAGIAISLRIALDSGRRTYRYSELASQLKAVAKDLAALKSEAAVRRTVAATEEVLLDEVIEWHLAEQQNGAH